jgi:kinesin family protein 18/19
MSLDPMSDPSGRDIGTRITVVVRVRPPTDRENLSAHGNAVHVLDDRVLIFDPPGERVQKQTFLQTSQARAKNLPFAFDKVLAPDCTQSDVFDIVKNTIFSDEGGLLDGFNCTVFAYGATGSGKTYSMAGTPENPGLMSRAVQHIFTSLEQQGRRGKLRLSYLEIYNEYVRDLLVARDRPQPVLKIVEDPETGINVTHLCYCYPETTEQVLELIQLGNSRRTQAVTDSNPVSSRSHAVCQILVENCEDLPGVSASNPIGKLSLIDLAGSERATTNTGIRLRESTKINSSLLALSNCINALCTQAPFIPFRLSNLTRLLKDSLGGNCKTVCLSCVSPSYLSYEDTYSTLQYANKTKNVRTNVSRNTLDISARIAEYPRIIAELRAQVQLLQQASGSGAAEFESAIEEPFAQHKASIQFILSRAREELSAPDLESQISVLNKAAKTDIKRRLNQKVAIFTAECAKRRPPEPNAAIDSVQRARTLELDNLSLRAQLELQERQLSMHQNVIRQLMHSRSAENGIPVVSLSDQEAIKTLPIPPPLSARLLTETRVPLAELQKIRLPGAPSESGLLRHKLQAKGRADHTELVEATPSAAPLSSQAKLPTKALIDQLLQRVIAMNAQNGASQPGSAIRPNSTMTPTAAVAFRRNPLEMKMLE